MTFSLSNSACNPGIKNIFLNHFLIQEGTFKLCNFISTNVYFSDKGMNLIQYVFMVGFCLSALPILVCLYLILSLLLFSFFTLSMINIYKLLQNSGYILIRKKYIPCFVHFSLWTSQHWHLILNHNTLFLDCLPAIELPGKVLSNTLKATGLG